MDAAEPPDAPERPARITASSLFSETFRAWTAGFTRWTAISVLLHAPLPLLGWALLRNSGAGSAPSSAWGFLHGIVGGVISMLVSAAVVYGVVQERRGRTAGVGACISAAFSSFGPILGMSILVGLLAIVAALPGGIAMVVIVMSKIMKEGHLAHPTPQDLVVSEIAVPLLLVGLASAALVAIVQARFAVASASILVERCGATQSMGESGRLTAGHRTALWVVLMTLGVLLALASGIVLIAAADTRTSEFLGIALQALLANPLGACVCAVAYVALKREKDGVDVSNLASIGKVFD